MIPSLEIQLENKFLSLLLKRRVVKLLRVVPKEHLLGLEKIVLAESILLKKSKDLGGLYNKKKDREPCSIELSVNSLFRGMPKILHLLPFVSTFVLATALYHEIGHHYHTKFTHGISKREREDFANRYSKEMMKKRFRWWLFFLSPFSPIIKYFRDKVTRRQH